MALQRIEDIKNQPFLCLLLFVLAIVVALGANFAFSLRASEKLLHQMTLLTPGSNLNQVADRLGQKILETDDLDFMVMRGPLKDRSFLQGKKLFWFYSSAPPYRALAVYTDENNRILFVTWQSL